jgi:hypothetical protein
MTRRMTMPSPNSVESTGDESLGSGAADAPVVEDNHWHVELGPIPNVPDWHAQATGSSYAFPDQKAAEAFARVHKLGEPGRDVRVVAPASPVV